MVSLKLKLLSFLLYLLSSIYIFVMFINSLLKLQLNKVGYINKISYTNKIGYTNRIGCIGKIGYRVSKVKVRVLIVVYKVKFSVVLVLVLAKLFLKRQSIYFKLNFPIAIIYSLILSLVYFISSSFYKVLNNNLGTIVFLYFFTYTPLVRRSI